MSGLISRGRQSTNMSRSFRPQAVLLTQGAPEWKHFASSDHPTFTQLECLHKNKMLCKLSPHDEAASNHSPSPGDSQWAAASACDSVLWLVGRGGAGRPGLIKWMGEVFVQRVRLIPNNHLRGGGGAFSPEESREHISKREGGGRSAMFGLPNK